MAWLLRRGNGLSGFTALCLEVHHNWRGEHTMIRLHPSVHDL